MTGGAIVTIDAANFLSALANMADLLKKMRTTSDTELALEESERMKALTTQMQKMVANNDLTFSGSFTANHLREGKAGSPS
jgi:hypothetical protein